MVWSIKVNDVVDPDFISINVMDSIAGTKKFDATFSSAEKDTVFDHYEDVKIYGEGGGIIFRGRIEEMIPDHTADTTTISGRDYLSELIDKYVVEAYSTKLRSYIVDDIVDKNSAHLTRSNVQASSAGTELTYTFKSSVWDVLVQCAGEDEYRFWVDTSNDIHYVPRGYTDSGLTLILGTDDIYSFNIEERSGEIVNRYTLYGGGTPQVIVMLEDMDSQSYYGIVKEVRIVDDQVDTIALATTQAEAYLAENAWVLDMMTFEVDGYEALNAGEIVHVTISSHNIDSDYLVIDKVHRFPSSVTTIRVARYAKNLESIINSLVERLLKLEQTFMDENAIMARIVKIYEQQGQTDTIKIYSRTVGVSFRLGVTNHCELGKMTLKDNTGVWSQEYSGS